MGRYAGLIVLFAASLAAASPAGATLNRMAIGAKYSLGGNWLLTGSGLFRLNDNGYQAKFVGFIGLEHTWVSQ